MTERVRRFDQSIFYAFSLCISLSIECVWLVQLVMVESVWYISVLDKKKYIALSLHIWQSEYVVSIDFLRVFFMYLSLYRMIGFLLYGWFI
jgi:hypothetical protein